LPASNFPNLHKNFIGREEYLKEMNSIFFSNNDRNNKKTVVLSSFEGYGKSSIALKYAQEFKLNGFVYWIKSNKNNSDLELLSLASDIGIYFQNSKEKQNSDFVITTITNKLKNLNKRILFIFDNYDDESSNTMKYIIKLTEITNVFILITTTFFEFKEKNNCLKFLFLQPFSEKETNDFIRSNLKEINDSDLNQLTKKIDLNNKRPYILNKIVSEIKLKYENKSLQSILDELKEYSLYDKLVNDENSWKILQYSSFFDTDYIAYSIYKKFLKIEDNAFKESINKLEKMSIINICRNGLYSGIRLHRSLQYEIKEYSKEKENDKYIELFNDCCKKMTQANIEESDILKQLSYSKSYFSLKEFQQNVTQSSTISSELKSLWYSKFGFYSKNLNMYQDSLESFNLSLNIKKEIFGDNDNDESVANNIENIGLVHEDLCEYEKALSFYEKSLDMNRKIFKNDNQLSIAINLHHIGKIYEKLSLYEISLAYIKRSIEISHDLFVKKNCDDKRLYLNIAALSVNAGIVFSNLSQFDKAIFNFDEALKIYEIISENIQKANVLLNKGNVYFEKSLHKEAILNYEQALKLKKNFFGSDHLSISKIYNNLGGAYHQLGKNEKSLENYKNAFRITEFVFKNENNEILANISNNLAKIKYEMGDYEQALEEYKKLMGIYKKIYNTDDHYLIAYTKNLIGQVYLDKNDYDNALKYFTDSLKMKRKIFPNDSQISIVDTLVNIGGVYQKQGDYENALKSFENCLEISKKIFKNDDNETISKIYYNIGGVYQKKGDYKNALKSLENCLEISKNIFKNEDNEMFANIYHNIGNIYEEYNIYEKALENLKKSLEIKEKVFGKNNESIATTLFSIGYVYYYSGHYDLSLLNSLKSLEIYQELKFKKFNFLKNLTLIGQIYGKMCEFDKSISYYKSYLEYNKEIGFDDKVLANVIDELGKQYCNKGDYQKALENFEKSLEIKNQLINNEKGIADSFNQIGTIYIHLSLYDVALACFETSLVILRKLFINNDYHESIFKNLSDMAFTYSCMNMYDEALVNYNKSLEIAISLYGYNHPNVKMLKFEHLTNFFNNIIIPERN
jgi:tetratricopeptide (TPR) repeat protein